MQGIALGVLGSFSVPFYLPYEMLIIHFNQFLSEEIFRRETNYGFWKHVRRDVLFYAQGCAMYIVAWQRAPRAASREKIFPDRLLLSDRPQKWYARKEQILLRPVVITGIRSAKHDSV